MVTLILTDLPLELLHATVSYLRPFEIERVARTYNTKLYHICIPLLSRRLATQRHAKRMVARFGPTQHERRNLDYLNLNGDLSWLLPLDKVTFGQTVARHYRGPADSDHIIDSVVATAKRLSLALPNVFVNIMCSENLQKRMPLGGPFFILGPVGLLKCPAAVDGGAGGYIIRFFSDQQASFFYSLYLDTKGHCILSTLEDPNRWAWDMQDENDDLPESYTKKLDDLIAQGVIKQHEVDQAKEEGLHITTVGRTDFRLVGSDLEALMAEWYYWGKGYVSDMFNGPVPSDLQEFRENSYKEGSEDTI